MYIGEKCQLRGMNRALCKAESAINKEVTDVVQGNKNQRIARHHPGSALPLQQCDYGRLDSGVKKHEARPRPRGETLDGGRLGNYDGGGELCGVALT